MNNELYHWKYVSRQKVGNKWQYKYASDTKNSKGTGSTAAKNTLGKSNNWKYLKREKVNGKWQYTYTNVANKLKNSKAGQYVEGIKKDVAESKEKVKSGANEKNLHSLKDTDKLFSKTKGSWTQNGNTTYAKERGKIERTLDVGTEFLKDRLGYDELERYKKAKKASDQAEYDAKSYEEYTNKEFDNAIRYNPETDKHEYKSEGYKEYMHELWENLYSKRDAAKQSQKEASKALRDFYDTPIGKIDRVDGSIDRARTHIADMLESSSDSIANWLRKRNKKTGFIR